MIRFIFNLIFLFSILFLSQSVYAGSNLIDKDIGQKNFVLIGELGAGNMISLGSGYNIGNKIFNFEENKYFQYTGIIMGFTILEDAYVFEPSLFFDGDIVNRIKISEKQGLNIKWRLKFGYNYIKSKKYAIDGSAFTFGPDFLFKISYFYVNVSVPVIIGDEGTEIAPCIGTGVEFEL